MNSPRDGCFLILFHGNTTHCVQNHEEATFQASIFNKIKCVRTSHTNTGKHIDRALFKNKLSTLRYKNHICKLYFYLYKKNRSTWETILLKPFYLKIDIIISFLYWETKVNKY